MKYVLIVVVFCICTYVGYLFSVKYTKRKKFFQIILADCRRCRVIRITQDEKIITFLKGSAKITYIKAKIHFFSQVIIFLCAPGK